MKSAVGVRKRIVAPPPLFRFYLDEDVPPHAAVVARGLGLDVVSAAELGLHATPDEVHLSVAGRDGRILVTYNRDDFINLTRPAFASGSPHAGVLILTWKLPRDSVRVAHAIRRWAKIAAPRYGVPPLPSYTIDFTSGA